MQGRLTGGPGKLARLCARALIAGLTCAVFFAPNAGSAQPAPAAAPAAPATTNVGANLNISPKRITFNRADRSATVYVFNQGTTAATFDITLVDRIMLPDGQIIPADEAQSKPELHDEITALKSAQPMLVATPRRATLEPGKGQVIRLRAAPAVAGPAGNPPPAGEYRTHLTITTIPPRDTGLTAEQAAAANPQELRFQINAVFGVSIPVIVRIGQPDVRGAIENAKLAVQSISTDGVSPPKPTAVLTFDLVRLGATSMFGNLEVHGSRDKSANDALGVARGVGVYPEIGRRHMQMALLRVPAAGEKIEVLFKDDDTDPGHLIAKADITAP
jgi:P pilus assembly chaperone PapD